MNRRGRFAVLALALCLALPAWSKGWEPVGYTLRMNAFNTSNAFPGSSVAAADHGVEPRGELVSGVRLSKAYKLGVSLSAGGNAERAYTRGNFAWLGAGALLRHRTTTYTLDGEWTPKRDKFPTNVDEGGEYSGKKLTLGVRQALGSRARLRVEGTLDHDRFVPALSERDTRGRELFTSLSVTCAPGIDLRVEGSLARDIANGPKYDTNTHWFGVGLVRADSLWRTDLGVRSGVRFYPDNLEGAPNFRRRDQSIELRLHVTRALRPGLSVVAGGSLADKTSTRADLKFNSQTFTLGVEWVGGGK